MADKPESELELPAAPPPHPRESLVVALILLAVVAPLLYSVINSRQMPPQPAIERKPERVRDLLIDINSANEMELLHLPGIGPKLAARIVAERQQQGPFAGLADLRRVKGIGPKMLEKIRPFIAPTMEGDTTAAVR